MARKRASLKDKGMETLGPKQNKSRGIDILFGEPAEEREADRIDAAVEVKEPASTELDASSSRSHQPDRTESDLNQTEEKKRMPVDVNSKRSNSSNDAPSPQPGAVAAGSESLPVNEADVGLPEVSSSVAVVDELGLPVALESPPPDLIPAAPLPSRSVSASASVTGAAAGPVMAPTSGSVTVSQPVPVVSTGVTVDMPDLSGLEAEADLAGLKGDGPGLSTPSQGDLSGLVQEHDLSGLMAEVKSEPVAVTIAPANLPPSPPPAQAVPASKPVPPPQTAAVPAPSFRPAPAATVAAPPTPPIVSRPSTPSAGVTFGSDSTSGSAAPGVSLPQTKIESFGGIVTEKIRVPAQNIAPEDTAQSDRDSNIITIKEPAPVDENETLAEQVTRFIGPKRRENLDKEIELLYNHVAKELSVNKEDAEFALDTLRKAQDLVFEDPRQYDEALYLVATVRTMIARKRNMAHWSYTWGLLVFFYSFIWLVVFIAGYVFSGQLGIVVSSSSNENVRAILAAWFSALAGGVGGVIGILYSLYWHVAMKQDFDRQYVMYYLVQPIMGFVLGAVVYFIVASGSLLINIGAISSGATSSGQVLASPTVIALQVLLGWIAGFRQRFVFEMIDKIVQKISPQPDPNEAKKPVGLAPAERRPGKLPASGTAKDLEPPSGSKVEPEKGPLPPEAG